MSLPHEKDLDAMSWVVANCQFQALKDPNHRARIIELCNQADIATALSDIQDECHKIAENLESLDKIAGWLEEIDGSLGPVMDWFRDSDPHRRF